MQQTLQKLAAFKPAGGLRVAHVRAKVPICPQHGAGAGLFQPRLPRRGPYVGRQGQPSCWFAVIGWLLDWALCVILGVGLSLTLGANLLAGQV